MQHTATAQRTDTAAAAHRVARRVHGDLLAIHERFDMETESNLANLAHDVQVGLEHDCISQLKLFLYQKGATAPTRAYVYDRAAPGSFAPSSHSGNIERNTSLVGGELKYEIFLRDREIWEKLKKDGKLRISWSPCEGRSTAGMKSRIDGGYTSGEIGLSRACFSRESQ